MTCPDCEYHKNRAARWRAEAYKHAGYDIELPWVGLTNEEISSVAYNTNPLDGIRAFARAIETKLKEKNT